MGDPRFWATSLFVLGGGVVRRGLGALPTPSCRPRGHSRTSLWCGKTSSHPRTSRSSDFRGWRDLPALLSGTLSRRRRCRTSVSLAAAAPEMLRTAAGGSGRELRTRDPLLLLPALHLRLQSALGFGRGSALLRPSPVVRFPGPTAEAPRPGSLMAILGWQATTSLSLPPGGGAISSRCAPRSRQLESCDGASCVQSAGSRADPSCWNAVRAIYPAPDSWYPERAALKSTAFCASPSMLTGLALAQNRTWVLGLPGDSESPGKSYFLCGLRTTQMGMFVLLHATNIPFYHHFNHFRPSVGSIGHSLH